MLSFLNCAAKVVILRDSAKFLSEKFIIKVKKSIFAAPKRKNDAGKATSYCYCHLFILYIRGMLPEMVQPWRRQYVVFKAKYTRSIIHTAEKLKYTIAYVIDQMS